MSKQEWIELFVVNFLSTYSANKLSSGYAVDSNKQIYSTMLPIKEAYIVAENAWDEKRKNKFETDIVYVGNF